MINPECPKCKSNKNIIVMSVGFRCAFCSERFFKSDLIDETGSTQTKLTNK